MCIRDSLKFCIEHFLIVWSPCRLKHPYALLARFHFPVQIFKYRKGSLHEFRTPVKRSPLSSCAAITVHPVHTIFVNKSYQALGKLLDSFIESFRRRVPVSAQHLVLCIHNAGKCTHENTPLPGKITVNLFLERGGEKIS